MNLNRKSKDGKKLVMSLMMVKNKFKTVRKRTDDGRF